MPAAAVGWAEGIFRTSPAWRLVQPSSMVRFAFLRASTVMLYFVAIAPQVSFACTVYEPAGTGVGVPRLAEVVGAPPEELMLPSGRMRYVT